MKVGLDHLELMQLHVEALFTHDLQGRLLRVNEPAGDGLAPRFFLGQTAAGRVFLSRADVDQHRQCALENAATQLPAGSNPLHTPLDPAPFCAILARDTPVTSVERGPAFVCPDGLPDAHGTVAVTAHTADYLRPLLSAWLADVAHYQPMLALIRDEQAVALCCSVRRTERAHEAGVETARAARGRGYALAVIAAWATAVRAAGRVPLYSTSWENAASRAVAEKLGCVQFGNDLHIT